MTGEETGFLYPFLDASERDSAALLADLASSASSKAVESAALRRSTIGDLDRELTATAEAMAARFLAGGRLLACGNGGSATDATSLVERFLRPPAALSVRPLPARSLVDDQAVLTALANDIGFDVVFSRQVMAFGRADDIVVGLSTSGSSENLLRAFAAGRAAGMLTVGVAGGDGGRMAASADVDHCLVVRATSIHRIQEAQAAVVAELWARVHRHLDDDAATPR